MLPDPLDTDSDPDRGAAPDVGDTGDPNGTWRRSQKSLSDYGRFASVGLQFGIVLVLFSLAGYWLDQRLGTTPWLLVTGAGVGFVGGLVSMIKRIPVPTRRRKRDA
ncbi:MAG: AtpZ/AtpI family protein [Planctomycetota bacterium]